MKGGITATLKQHWLLIIAIVLFVWWLHLKRTVKAVTSTSVRMDTGDSQQQVQCYDQMGKPYDCGLIVF